MHVLLVSHQLDYSGAPLALLEASKILLNLGFTVRLFPLSQGPLSREFEVAGVQVLSKLETHNVDRIVLNTSVCARLANLIYDRAQFILWIHESPLLFLHSDLPYIVSKAAERARAVLFPSLHVAGDWARYGPLRGDDNKFFYALSPVSILSSITDKGESQTTSTSSLLPLRIISIDPMENFRGHAVIADAIRMLHIQKMDVHLTLVGVSLLKAKELFPMLKPERIFATDRVPREQVVRYIEQSHVYVSATSFATQNLGLCEASISGIPSIVSDIDVHKSWAEKVGGGVQVYPLFSPAELAKKISAFHENYQEYRSLAHASAHLARKLTSEGRFAEVLKAALSR
jgi:glycosyltransferase involved in cell wall biosynthesis